MLDSTTSQYVNPVIKLLDEKRRIVFEYTLAVTFFTFFIATEVMAQTGGYASYVFLNLSPSSRNTALGSHAMAYSSSDAGTAFLNPALINEKMSTALNFSHQFFFSDMGSGHFSYTLKPGKWGLQWQTGIQYLNSSSIPFTDIYGQVNGAFKIRESAFYIGSAKQLNERIRAGANIHYVFSNLGLSSSSALGVSLGLQYSNPVNRTSIAIAIRNVGFSIDSYEKVKENLPLTLELGISKRLNHLPFVYQITAHHLERWNVRYDDPAISQSGNLFDEQKEKSDFSKFSDNLLRHFAFGGEMLLGKKETFSLRIGYNHLRRKELNAKDYASFSGLSFGMGIKISKFKIDYSYALYHIAGGTNQLTLQTQLSSFMKERNL
ncbi:MAG: type IX secretion system protein PorQ [Saprospiraceae bacterium]|nr:type IX secretion system protein PorQ [Candidatus Vicinibacter affinis]